MSGAIVARPRLALGSLFSGIGGLELGLECALRDGGFDVDTVFQCEADPWCRGILARHWPSALRFNDVRAVGAHNAPRVDLLCGGSPCQDLSLAGKRAGLEGERSGLWSEQARTIRELRPAIAVWENVPGARSPVRVGGVAVAQPAIATVLGDLSALGYDAVWFTVRAADVGAPHVRERVFVVGWRVGDAAGARREGGAGDRGEGEGRVSGVAAGADSDIVADPRRIDGDGRAHGHEGRESHGPAPRRDEGSGDDQRGRGGEAAGVGLADPRSEGLEGQRQLHSEDARGPRRQGRSARARGRRSAQPGLGGDAPGLPRRVDLAAHRWPVGPGEAQPEGEPPRVTTERRERRQRLKALGNAVVPQVAYVVGCVVARVLREVFA